jgi:hypothetical protein
LPNGQSLSQATVLMSNQLLGKLLGMDLLHAMQSQPDVKKAIRWVNNIHASGVEPVTSTMSGKSRLLPLWLHADNSQQSNIC